MTGEVVLFQGRGCQGGFGVEEAGELGDEGVTLDGVSFLSLSYFCQWLFRLLYVLVQAGLSVVIQVVAHPLLVAEVVSPWRHIGHRCERLVRSVDRDKQIISIIHPSPNLL